MKLELQHLTLRGPFPRMQGWGSNWSTPLSQGHHLGPGGSWTPNTNPTGVTPILHDYLPLGGGLFNSLDSEFVTKKNQQDWLVCSLFGSLLTPPLGLGGGLGLRRECWAQLGQTPWRWTSYSRHWRGPCLGIKGLESFYGLASDTHQEILPEPETTEEVVDVSLLKTSCKAETSL